MTTAFIAIAAGILILGGYFFPAFQAVQILLLNWAIILAGVATLVGFFNLILVHTDKIRRNEQGSIYSALLVISLVITFLLGLILRPDHAVMKALVDGIIIPAEAALMALLAVSLLYAAIRLLRRRVDVMSVLFLATAILLILGSITLPNANDIPLVGIFSRWVT
ncbi:MAG: hypothetical protein HYZ23_07540, partial [Chloroflexi bacterium]|nr:hypothetical protein [Chloroflexota bacterium]